MAGRWYGFVPRKAATMRLALIVLSVVVLLPACGVFASQARGAPAGAVSGQLGSAAGHAQHHGSAVSADPCASVAMNATATAPERGALLALAPVVPLYPAATMFLPRSAAAAHPPPAKASFYLRSTRILR